MNGKNSTFRGGRSTWANACVGENGVTDYRVYARGYSNAAKLLIAEALRTRGLDHSVDELVYAVCFNMRHSLELHLKASIIELGEIETIRRRNLEFDLKGSHDIGNIWKFFVQTSESIDKRFKPVNELLHDLVDDISEIDPTGQTFRYPNDLESQKHLTDVSLINFFTLRERFSALERRLNDLESLCRYLIQEYSLGTFTQNLSRCQIAHIAKTLPDRTAWNSASFDNIKAQIKKSFDISSRELSAAIEIIEDHREFCAEIGLSKDLLGTTNEFLSNFFDVWFLLHDQHSDTEDVDLEAHTWTLGEALEASKGADEIKSQVWSRLRHEVTSDQLAGLYALVYFGRELDFAETYNRIYALEREGLNRSKSFRQAFFHIYDKSTASGDILASLYFLKKREVADRLVEKHKLESKLSWLDSARDGRHFHKPEFCGYGS